MAFQFARKISVYVGAGGISAALIFLLGALIYREWIPASAGRFFGGAIEAAYTTYGPGFILMVVGVISLLIMHERLWLYFIREKNKEIQRVVEQRNKLEDILLKQRGSSGPRGRKR